MNIALIIIGIFMIYMNIKALKKENFKDGLKEKIENTTEYEVHIGQLRRDFSETIIELQKKEEENYEKNLVLEYKIKELEEQINKINYLSVYNKEIKIEKIQQEAKENKINKNEIKLKDKKEEINKKNYEEKSKKYEKIKEDNKNNKISKDNKKDLKNEKDVKINKISEALKKGENIEEIAKKLHMSKGEVLLIKELYIK